MGYNPTRHDPNTYNALEMSDEDALHQLLAYKPYKFPDENENDHTTSLYYKLGELCPNVWVSEVSFLKASLFGDDDYIPGVVQVVQELIGEDFPVLNDELLQKLTDAINADYDPSYYGQMHQNTKNEIIEWLNENKGSELFIIAW